MSDQSTTMGRTRGRARGSSRQCADQEIPSSPQAGEGNEQKNDEICANVSREGNQVNNFGSTYFQFREVTVYFYNVVFEPEVSSINMRRSLLFSHKEDFGGVMVYDNVSKVKTIRFLPEKLEYFSGSKEDYLQVKIILKRIGERSLDYPQMLRLYNNQMRENLRVLKRNLRNGHYFDTRIRHILCEQELETLQEVLTNIINQS